MKNAVRLNTKGVFAKATAKSFGMLWLIDDTPGLYIHVVGCKSDHEATGENTVVATHNGQFGVFRRLLELEKIVSEACKE